MGKIKVCRIYSSDFEAMDTTQKGQLLQEFYFNLDGYVRELVRYDSQGQVIGRFEITGEDTPFPMPKEPTYFDTVLTIATLGPNGHLRETELKRYNKSGMLTETCLYDSTDALFKKNTYNYNQWGYITEDIYWDLELNAPSQVIRYLYEYYPN